MTIQPSIDQIQLDNDAFSTSVADLRAAADELGVRRDRACADVADLLDAGWRGAAADSFAAGWEEWRSASQRVLDGLAGMTSLLDAAHRDLSARDEDSRQRLDIVSTRLADRLG